MIWRLSLVLLLLHSCVKAFDVGCDKMCKTCAILADPYACTSCTDGLRLLVLVNDDFGNCDTVENCAAMGGLVITSSKKCFIGGSCPPGYFKNSTNCISCHTSCKECFGPGSNECLVCPEGKSLSLDNGIGGTCIDKTTCKNQSFANGALCAESSANCATGCGTCYSSSSSQCRSCNETGLQYLVENYINSNVSWGSCSASITLKRMAYTFSFDPKSALVQFKCHWACKSCVAENDPLACTSCSNSAYLNVITELGGVPVGNCKPTCVNSKERSLTLGGRKYCSSLGTSFCSYIYRHVSI